MSLTPEQIAQIATQAAMAAVAAATADTSEEPKQVDTVTSKVLADMPKRQSVKRAADTTAKVSAITENLDAILLHGGKVKPLAAGQPIPSDGYAVKIAAQGSGEEATIFTGGARFMLYDSGKQLHRNMLPLAVLGALADDDIRAAIAGSIESVNERALLADHQTPEIRAIRAAAKRRVKVAAA